MKRDSNDRSNPSFVVVPALRPPHRLSGGVLFAVFSGLILCGGRGAFRFSAIAALPAGSFRCRFPSRGSAVPFRPAAVCRTSHLLPPLLRCPVVGFLCAALSHRSVRRPFAECRTSSRRSCVVLSRGSIARPSVRRIERYVPLKKNVLPSRRMQDVCRNARNAYFAAFFLS